MTLNYTTDALIDRVRRTCQLKTDNAKLSTNEILQICDEEIQQNLLPSLLKVRDDYQMTVTTIPLAEGIGQYRLPFSASSSTIDHVEAFQFSSDTTIGAYILPRIETPGKLAYEGPQAVNRSVPSAYTLQGDTLYVLPRPNTYMAQNFIIRVVHEWRPNRLALSADCSSISFAAANVNPLYIDLTLTAPIASTMTTGTLIDILPSQPPMMPLALGGSVISVASDPIITVFPGYSISRAEALSQISQTVLPVIAPRGYTCTFPLPDAWWNAAVLACSASVCRVIGDAVGMATNLEAAQASVDRLIAMQSNRVRKQPHVPFDKASPIRRGWTWGGFGRGGVGP